MLKRIFTNNKLLKRAFSDNAGATSNMIENINQTIKGIQHINYVKEHDPTLTEEQKKSMKQFLVYRTNPSDPDDQPHFMSYYIDPQGKPMYLDALLHIKNDHDST